MLFLYDQSNKILSKSHSSPNFENTWCPDPLYAWYGKAKKLSLRVGKCWVLPTHWLPSLGRSEVISALKLEGIFAMDLTQWKTPKEKLDYGLRRVKFWIGRVILKIGFMSKTMANRGWLQSRTCSSNYWIIIIYCQDWSHLENHTCTFRWYYTDLLSHTGPSAALKSKSNCMMDVGE